MEHGENRKVIYQMSVPLQLHYFTWEVKSVRTRVMTEE